MRSCGKFLVLNLFRCLNSPGMDKTARLSPVAPFRRVSSRCTDLASWSRTHRCNTLPDMLRSTCLPVGRILGTEAHTRWRRDVGRGDSSREGDGSLSAQTACVFEEEESQQPSNQGSLEEAQRRRVRSLLVGHLLLVCALTFIQAICSMAELVSSVYYAGRRSQN